ncbi:aromatic acid exporter family protein [Streptomyces boncukensis]|uniref:Integral membrane protein n=1 Tax=Streptomyces boncukensis TaxID=2711219 RepID=A0A6G4X286_9ACTN|nr:hypothetical protein [Streptomyces boncukensis]
MRSVAGAVRAEAETVARAVLRACRGPSQERDLLVQSLKAALAALIAWVVARLWVDAALALMAPWVAVVLVQSTVYQSLAHGMRQSVAIALGTVLATAAALSLGHTEGAIALVLPVTLLLSNWPRFGAQGVYGTTAALFTLASGAVSVRDAGVRVALALLGAVIGIAVNAVVLPPVYLRSTREAVQAVLREVEEILGDVTDGLDEPLDYQRALAWYERAQRLSHLVRSARSAIEWSRESRLLHLRHRKRAEVARLAPAYDATLYTLEQVTAHVSDLTRTFLEAVDEDDTSPWPDPGVTGPYAEFLGQVRGALGAYRRVLTGGDASAAREELHRRMRRVERTHDELSSELPRWTSGDPEALAVFGSLLMDARRITARLLADGAAPG